MRRFDALVIHATATPEGRWFSAEDIVRWHTAKPPQGQGWSRPGYNYIILLDGELPKKEDLHKDNPASIVRVLIPHDFDTLVEPNEISFNIGATPFGYANNNTLSICYIGGIARDFKTPKDTRTEKQRLAMEFIVKYFIETYSKQNHEFKIMGHNQVANKACPCFYVPCWLQSIGVPDKYIYTHDPFKYKNYFKNLYKNPCYGSN
jgi:hypothetical protein